MRALISLAVVLCLFNSGLASISLKNIDVSREGDSVYVDITTSEPSLYEHFMIKDAPEKVVVDLKGTINSWSKKRFDNLPFNSIKRIRTSQFQVEPELISRIVLDVNRPVDYRVEELPLGVRIKIPVSEDEQPFDPWSAIESAEIVEPVKDEMPIQSPPQVENPKAEPEPMTPPATPVEDFPKRESASYEAKSSRDPFKSLVGKGATLLAGQIPSVENLSLVGIFDDESGRKALFEDSEGNGFILMPDDRVQNGYLVSIHKDKAIFQISEYGWTRTVALNLQMPELK